MITICYILMAESWNPSHQPVLNRLVPVPHNSMRSFLRNTYGLRSVLRSRSRPATSHVFFLSGARADVSTFDFLEPFNKTFEANDEKICC